MSSDFTEEVQRRYSGRKFGNITGTIDGFEYINERAYFNYQRDKVYFREKRLKKQPKKKRKKVLPKPDSVIIIKETAICPHCKSGKTEISTYGMHTKLVFDLKIRKKGLSKYVLLYKSHAVKCTKCNRTFRSPKYQLLSKYGHNLMSWVIYQYVANICSCVKINRMISDFFDMNLGDDTCYSFKGIMSSYYRSTYEELKDGIKAWKILHIDETKAKLRGGYGYVWVFTNLNSVIYMLRSDRSTEFLNELLHDFNGVLISDFYKGFDKLPCKQQKCLIHLLRDVNDMVFREQQNEQLIVISAKFSELMRRIVNTIDKFGLRKRNLNKHNSNVDSFFEFLSELEPTSKSVKKLKKRLLANKNELFTFLNFNDVPWNNNNAEHSIKHFALYRKEVKGLINENGLDKYLVLLSLLKTCEYSDISFFKFLLSKEISITKYKENYTKSGNRRKTLPLPSTENFINLDRVT